MRFVFRADAGVTQGSGHVMRCLTLAQELASRGHEIVFVTAVESITWLSDHLATTGYDVIPATAHEINENALLGLNPDWVIVDSYRFTADSVTALSRSTKVLAIVDGDTRGIEAQLYLEQNLGAELIDWAVEPGRMLAGAAYALIRDEFLIARPEEPATVGKPMRLAAFMGGTDADGAIVRVAQQIATVDVAMHLTMVAPVRWHDDVRAALEGWDVTVIEPTTELPRILGSANVVVSAAGTSAWDVCTLGIPSLFIGVVENQSDSLARLRETGLAFGIDVSLGEPLDAVGPMVARLATDDAVRTAFASRCRTTFDGLGKARVADALEATTRR